MMEGIQKQKPLTNTSKEMGLVGSSVPKKYSEDPEAIFPGSKADVSHWTVAVESSSKSNDGNKLLKDKRDYKKTRLAGTKPSKDSLKQESSNQTWSGGGKSNNSSENITKVMDDKDYRKIEKRKNSLLQSAPSDLLDYHEQRKSLKKWDENTNTEKENTTACTLKRHSIHLDDEITVRKNKEEPNKTKTFSPLSYSKYKKQTSKKKSKEQKNKLQALLSHGASPDTIKKNNSIKSSSDEDEGIEIMESCSDLSEEGARVASSSQGSKQLQQSRIISTSLPNVNISVCSRCVKASSLATDAPRSEVPEDEYFESISQLVSNGTYRPKWPTLQSSRGEETEDNPSEVDFKKQIPRKVSYQNDDKCENYKSDVFTKSDLFSKKPIPNNQLVESESESIVSTPDQLISKAPI